MFTHIFMFLVFDARRALSKLRSNELMGCLSDASVAASLDPASYKAFHRRGMAKKELGFLEVGRVGTKGRDGGRRPRTTQPPPPSIPVKGSEPPSSFVASSCLSHFVSSRQPGTT